MDLYAKESLQKLADLPIVQVPEAGVWDGFVRGTGMYTMQTLAKTARAVDLLGSVGPIAQDLFTGGTEAQDKYFKEHEQWQSAVDYWTPGVGEVGLAGQIAGQVMGTLAQVLVSPGLAIGGMQLGTAEDLVNKGVSPTRANIAGAIQGVTLGAGIWMPILGATYLQRALVGGVAANVAMGAVSRGITGQALEDTPAAGEFQAFDRASLFTDALLGLAFGSMVQMSPQARAQGTQAWETLRDWASNLKPSEIAAIATLRQAQHMNVDSAPGKPVDPTDVEAHVNRMKAAIDQLDAGAPVSVEHMPAGKFDPDPVREAENVAQMETMVQAAEQIRADEGLTEPKLPAYLNTTPEMQRTYESLQQLPREEQAQGVGDIIESQLRRIGVDETEARASASIWQAFAQTTADKYGINPADILTRYGVGVSRGTPIDSAYTLEQAFRGTDPVDAAAIGEGKTIDIGGVQRPTTNSEGRPIAGTTEQVRAFYEWFQDSKVVDEQGRPLVVYHGTKGSFDVFDTSGMFRSKQLGAMFTADRSYAENYGRVERGGRVIEAYLSIENPLDANDAGKIAEYRANKYQVESLVKYAKRAGYDGVITSLDEYVVFRPEQIKSAIGNRGTFDPNDPNILFQSTPSPEPFYSALGRQVDASPMKQGDAKAWKNWIKSLGSKGVKADEIKWSGIDEWLDLQAGKVTKAEVQEYLAGNGVKVEEVPLGGQSPEAIAWERFQQQMREKYGERYTVDDMSEADDAMRVELSSAMEGSEPRSPKFAEYQLPGAKEGSYRELLLTLPDKRESTDYKHIARDLGIEITPAAGQDWRDAFLSHPERERITVEYERRSEANGTEILDAMPGEPGTTPGRNFTSSHFDQPNILAHVRFNERTDADGKRVLFIEEIQSDWAQQGRKKGFQGDFLPPALDTDVELRFVEPVVPEGGDPENHPGYWESTDRRTGQLIGRHGGRLSEGSAMREALQLEYYAYDKRRSAVPNGPFVTKTEAWTALTLKRMIRYAAENGFDRIAWTTGEQQVSRYAQALRKAVDVIEWTKTKDGVQIVGYKGTGRQAEIAPGISRAARDALERNDDLGFDDTNQALHAIWTHTDWEVRWEVNPQDRAALRSYVIARREAMLTTAKNKVVDTTEKEDALSDSIGKAMADRIRNDPNQSGTIEGEDITVSDTGMAGFYDRIVPSVAKEVMKKLGGGKVGEVKLDIPPESEGKYGMGAFDPGTARVVNPTRGVFQVLAANQRSGVEQVRGGNFDSREAAQAYLETGASGLQTQPAIEITPAMREAAMAGQPLFQGGRGQIIFGDGQTLINLFETADRSTMLHETGHFFLQVTRDLATAPNAPAIAVRDWAMLANWLELDSDTIPREAHEKFARGFEAYVMEGKAPSPELKNVFQQFRDWLLQIYRSLTDLDVELTDDIRGVMDRMLASKASDAPPGAKSSAPLESPVVDGPPPPDVGRTTPAAAEPMTADQPEMQAILDSMARQEAGWAQIGGRHMGGPAGTPNFSTWIPKSDWWTDRPDKLNEAKVKEAVRKLLAGEPLKKAEQRMIDYMTEVANRRLAAMRDTIDEAQAGLDDLADQIDAIDAEGADAGPQDALSAEAERYVMEHPGQLITIGRNPDGTPNQVSAEQYLDDAWETATQARDDAQLFQVAADCWIGKM